jgi:hypothetical protein
MMVYEAKSDIIIGKDVLPNDYVKLSPFKTIDINNQTTTNILGITVASKDRITNYVELSKISTSTKVIPPSKNS